MIKIFTIGFTKKSARDFFGRLKKSRAKTLIDVRLNNSSQLSGFARGDHVEYLAEEVCGMGYKHIPETLAPTKEILDAYKKSKTMSWDDYENRFRKLIAERKIEEMDPALLDGGCLLCSEDTPHHCHRRLIAEYLQDKWPDVEIDHL